MTSRICLSFIPRTFPRVALTTDRPRTGFWRAQDARELVRELDAAGGGRRVLPRRFRCDRLRIDSQTSDTCSLRRTAACTMVCAAVLSSASANFETVASSSARNYFVATGLGLPRLRSTHGSSSYSSRCRCRYRPALPRPPAPLGRPALRRPAALASTVCASAIAHCRFAMRTRPPAVSRFVGPVPCRTRSGSRRAWRVRRSSSR